MAHTHAHSHDHAHHHANASSKRLLIALVLTLVFAALEAIGGWWSGSLALLGDAGHMLSDSTALGIALVAARVSLRPPSNRLSYGHGRIEVVAAIANSLFMMLVVVGIVAEAIERFSHPGSIDALSVIVIGAAGLVINIVVAYVLSHDRHNLNTRAALLHVFGDLLGSLAAITSGITIYYFGWMLIDPLVSLLICSLIVFSSVRLLREALHIIMEGVPGHLDLKQVGQAMAAADERIQSVHDLHIWTLASGYVALSAHIVLPDLDHWQEILASEQRILSAEFGIEHITLQPEIRRGETVVPIDQLFG